MARRRLPAVLLVAVLIPSAVLAYSLSAEKKYTATAKLLFRDPAFDQKLFGTTVLAPSLDPAREAATNVSLVSLDTITTRASKAIRPRLTPSEIRDRITVAAQGQSNVVVVLATDSDPRFAARLANTIADQYIRFRRQADRAKINEALTLVRRQLRLLSPAARRAREGQTLRDRVEQLRVLSSLQTGNAELVQPAARPGSASSPKVLRNVVLGVIGGLILSLVAALLLDVLDRRVRLRRDAEAIFGRPVLAAIPESRSLRTDGGEALHLSGAEAEAFRTLRTNLRYFDVDREIRSVLVTSSAPGDGKSTVARYLALTAAVSKVSVVLLEADLRRPALGDVLDNLNERGLVNVLADHEPIADVIQHVPVHMAGLPDLGVKLDVVTSGSTPPNPTDLLESDRMGSVLAELEGRYDLVVVDTSPLTVVPDAIPLLGRVSGIAVVVRDGKSTKTAARELRRQLDHLNVSPLGIVINGSSIPRDAASYGYYLHGSPASRGTRAEDSRNGRLSVRWPNPRRRQHEDGGDQKAAATGPSRDTQA